MAALLLSACAEIPVLQKPLTVALQVTGKEADDGKRQRCATTARQMGAFLSDQAPLVTNVVLEGHNRVVIARGGQVLLSENLTGDATEVLCINAIQKAAQFAQLAVPLRELVQQHVLNEPAFRALAEAAGHAATAYLTAAEAPIEELDEGSDAYVEAQKETDAAHDSFRRFLTYDRAVPPSALDTKDIVLSDTTGEATRIRLAGTGNLLRVGVDNNHVTLIGIETDRGRQILGFDSDTKPIVTAEFRTFLIGDKIDFHGTIKRRIKRAESESATAPAAPSAASGCTKDTDCKGDRICIDGKCASPKR